MSFSEGVWMARSYRMTGALALVFIFIVALAPRTADGQVPTVADFAACNDEAPRAVRTGSASPTSNDIARADTVRASAPASSPTNDMGKVIESPDPQIHGMSAEGARNASYQAAYRSCMRRKGF